METVYRISVGVIYFVQFIGIIYCNKRSAVDDVLLNKREPLWMLAIRVPGAVLVVASIVLYVVDPGILSFAELPLADPLRMAGILIGCGVDACLFWTLFSLGRNISMSLSLGGNHSLVMTGPYSSVRHPMYSLGILLFISLMLVSSNWFIGLVGIGFQLFVMIVRTPLEEKMLENYFTDDYLRYKSVTGKFVPRWSRKG